MKGGYGNITILGVDLFGCSEDDFYATRFEADNPQGVRIQGTVCCGLLLKRCTIRY